MPVVPLTINQSLNGKRILLRASLNVPVVQGRVTNTFRLRASLRTIQSLALQGARVVVCAHIGRAKTDSLRPVWEEMRRLSNVPLFFSEEVVGARAAAKAAALKNGEVLLLENVRREDGEAQNSPAFAAQLASMGSIYVNDAFSDSHRQHASIVGVPRLMREHYAGPNFMQELEGILPARSPKSPSLAIVGGAKFLTKEPFIAFLLDTYDAVFIGGALAHDFLRAQGFELGRSLVSGAAIDPALLKNSKLTLPEDVVVQNALGREEKMVDEVLPEDTILDVGPRTLARLAPHIAKARSLLWNGPLGNFEHGFDQGTKQCAQMVAASTATSIVGGGDTVAAIEGLGINGHFSYVSGAGGAMLDYIADGTLVGIDALNN